VSRCEEILPLVACRASGPLDQEDEELVTAHLDQCAACRAQMDRDEELLAELSLPPAAPELAAALERLPARSAVEWRKGERRRQRVLKFLGASVAAAAVIVTVLAPAWLRDRALARSRQAGEVAEVAPAGAAPTPPSAAAAPVQTASWEGADLDAAWEASAVVAGDSGAEVAMSDEGTIFESASNP
jgi:anti-sigma factor RsiW